MTASRTAMRMTAVRLLAAIFVLACCGLVPQVQAQKPTTDRPARVMSGELHGARMGVMQGLIIKRVNPVYPETAKQLGIQGQVLLGVIVDPQGRVTDVWVEYGPEELWEAAATAVRQWEYRPYMLNGQPIEVFTNVAITFVPPGGPSAPGSPHTTGHAPSPAAEKAK